MTQRCIAGGIWSKTISPQSRSSAPSPRDTTRQSKASAPTSTLPLRSSPQGKCQQTLERLLVDSFTALVRAGVASLDRVAQDGVRVRASAGAASFRRHSTLQDCRRDAAKALADLRAQVNADPGAVSRQQAAARQRAAEDRERRVRAALAVNEELHVQQQEQARLEASRAMKKAQEAARNNK